MICHEFFSGKPVLVAGFVVLAACSASKAPAPPTGANVAKVADPVFTNDGIDAGSTGLEIDFGRTEGSTVAAMSKLMGSAPSRTGQCGPLRLAEWKDGTTLFFEPKPYDPPAFVGWATATGAAGRSCTL